MCDRRYRKWYTCRRFIQALFFLLGSIIYLSFPSGSVDDGGTSTFMLGNGQLISREMRRSPAWVARQNTGSLAVFKFQITKNFFKYKYTPRNIGVSDQNQIIFSVSRFHSICHNYTSYFFYKLLDCCSITVVYIYPPPLPCPRPQPPSYPP